MSPKSELSQVQCRLVMATKLTCCLTLRHWLERQSNNSAHILWQHSYQNNTKYRKQWKWPITCILLLLTRVDS